MPNEASLGRGPANDQVLGWRCAPGISDVVDLFGGGTVPDIINVLTVYCITIKKYN